ncbi:MAG: Ig-like domain-containing protein, partial [Cyclobacteriaceae bacterium]
MKQFYSTFLLLASILFGQAIQAQDLGESYTPEDPVCVFTRDPIDRDIFIKPAPKGSGGVDGQSGIISPTATFIVNYPDGIAQDARDAFQYAVDIWSFQIASDVPIVIDFDFSDLPGNTLGSAGPSTLLRNFSGAPEANTFYPVALANKHAGFDLRPALADVDASFDNVTDWYYGTDGNTPGGQLDFVSVVLHELGHGLGFTGSSEEVTEGSTAEWGFDGDPYIYDLFVVNTTNQQYDDFASPSTGYYDYSTSDDLFVNGAKTVIANGGTNAKIYAPGTYDPGSSYSHWDETTYNGSDNALMTPQISNGEAIHDVGDITRAFFADMGWAAKPNDDLSPFNLEGVAVTDTRIDLTWADNSDEELGFEIHRSDIENSGFAKIGEVEADILIYNDLTVAQGNTYYYTVFAIGEGPVLSDPTNTVEVTACVSKIPTAGTWTVSAVVNAETYENNSVTIVEDALNNYTVSDVSGGFYAEPPNNFELNQAVQFEDVCGVLTITGRDGAEFDIGTDGNNTGSYTGTDDNITITLPWVDNGNPVSGVATYTRNNDAPLEAPTANAAQITFSNTGATSTDVAWTNGNGTGRIVIAREDVPPSLTDLPVDGTDYTADADFSGSGQALGDSKVVYNGADDGFTLSGLTFGTTYFLSVFEYKTTTNEYLFNTDNPPVNSVETTPLTAPTQSASAVLFDNVDLTTMNVSWTNGNGSNRIVVARDGAAPTGTPQEGTEYNANADFTAGEALGDGVVVYDGDGSAFTMTGLTASTTYHVAVYEYNNSTNEFLYKTDAPAIGNQATTDPDLTPPEIAGGGLDPANNATEVLITTDLSIEFDEPIQKGTGNITVFDVTDQLLQTVAVTSDDVSVDGNTAIIDLPEYLPSSTTIYVQIAAGAFEDASSNAFVGINDNTTWTFATSAFDCSGFVADNVTITVDSDETSCDAPNGALSATVDVGNGPVTAGYTFTWYNSGDLNTPIGDAAQIDGLAAGDYTVMVEDEATGCEAAKEASVGLNQVTPVLDEADVVTTTNTVCFGTPNGALSITVDGGQTNGYDFEWSIGGTPKQIPDFVGATYTGLGTGNYTVVAVNTATGCPSGSATFPVGTETTDPIVDETATIVPNSGCDGNNSGQISATADNGQTAGYTFSWWNGDTNNGQADFTGSIYGGLAAGEYTVQVQNDATGCISETRTFEVTTAAQDIPVVDAVVTNGEGCALPGEGEVRVTISSTNAPSAYNVEILQGQAVVQQETVTNGPAGITLDGLLDGSYTVRVTDNDKGCSTDKPITVAYTAIPLTVPQNVTIGDITDETATINWNAVAADATYEILYETASSDILSEVGTSGSNSFAVAGLTDSTVYEVSVLTVCDDGGTPAKSDYSAVKTFKTLLLCGADKTPAPTWYKDADGDGVGISNDIIIACEKPTGYVEDDGDCNDADPDVYPGAPKLPDGKDNDCDGIVDKANQSIDFALISNSLVSDNIIELVAEATSGLNVTFTAVGPVTITGSTAEITGTGDVVVTASQAGNDFFNAATNVIRLFKISKGNQVITFSELEDVKYADQTIPYTVTVDSELPLSIAVEGPAENTADGLKITGVGTVTVTASQAGNDLYNAATYARSFEVTKGDQELMISNSGGPFVPGDVSVITATSSVGLEVSLAIEGPGVLTGNEVTFESAGRVKVIATQAGNDNYSSPNPAILFIDVELAKTVIDPIELPDEIGENGEIDLPPTTPGGAPIVYTVTGPAFIDENGNLVITGPGLVTITSSLGENDLEEAEPLEDSFCVFPTKPTISSQVDEVNQVVVFTSSSAEGNQWFKNNVTATGETGQTFEIPIGVNAEIQVQVTIDGCESEVSEVVNGSGQQVTGIEDLISNGQLKAYPNPVLDVFSIELSGQIFDRAPVARLYTLDGQIINESEMRSEGFTWQT